MSPSGDRLREMAHRAGDVGARAAATAMAREGKQAIEEQLRKRSHEKGTPTPAAPGQPPAKISGRLHDSIRTTRPVQVGGDRWMTTVGPDDVPYARIQERGGVTGRNHATTLPPRPYVYPAVAALRANGRLREVSVEAFRAVVHGR